MVIGEAGYDDQSFLQHMGQKQGKDEWVNNHMNGSLLDPRAFLLYRIPESFIWSSNTGGSKSFVAGSVISYCTINKDRNTWPIAIYVLCFFKDVYFALILKPSENSSFFCLQLLNQHF